MKKNNYIFFKYYDIQKELRKIVIIYFNIFGKNSTYINLSNYFFSKIKIDKISLDKLDYYYNEFHIIQSINSTYKNLLTTNKDILLFQIYLYNLYLTKDFLHYIIGYKYLDYNINNYYILKNINKNILQNNYYLKKIYQNILLFLKENTTILQIFNLNSIRKFNKFINTTKYFLNNKNNIQILKKSKKQKYLKENQKLYLNIHQIYNISLCNQIKQEIKNKNNNYFKIYITKTNNNIFITYIFQNKLYYKSITAFGFKGKSKNSKYNCKIFFEYFIKNFYNIYKQTKLPLKTNIYLKNSILNNNIQNFLKKLNKLQNILRIQNIYDITNNPYNGCRKRKIAIKKHKKAIIKYLSQIK